MVVDGSTSCSLAGVFHNVALFSFVGLKRSVFFMRNARKGVNHHFSYTMRIGISLDVGWTTYIIGASHSSAHVLNRGLRKSKPADTTVRTVIALLSQPPAGERVSLQVLSFLPPFLPPSLLENLQRSLLSSNAHTTGQHRPTHTHTHTRGDTHYAPEKHMNNPLCTGTEST